MKLRHLLVLALMQTAIFPASAFAHQPGDDEIVFYPKKLYLSNSFDGTLITTAFDNGVLPLNGGIPTTIGTPRITWFLNTGFNLNYDFSSTVGIFTGLGIKNMGFIEKIKPLDSTVKRRVFAAGLPIGIKVGNLKRKTYGFIGGGVDVPLNYKEKGYIRRGAKDKLNEWFSDRTAAYMPYGFVGVSFAPGVYFKVQYYPNNFMNPDFVETDATLGAGIGAKPYSRYDVSMLMFSIGLDIRYSNKMKIKHKEHHETMM
ncbi:MAG: hypothetical protein KDC07_09865 [Chitinophagaceae bacterium]|nr:hypothetical protein [Chitinophagaceae bacterium]